MFWLYVHCSGHNFHVKIVISSRNFTVFYIDKEMYYLLIMFSFLYMFILMSFASVELLSCNKNVKIFSSQYCCASKLVASHLEIETDEAQSEFLSFCLVM